MLVFKTVEFVQLNQQDGFVPIQHVRCTFQDSFLGTFYINLQEVETAARYDAMHAHEAVDDEAGMQILFSALRALNVRSLLDVGSATGRGLPRLAGGLSKALICGVEPVEALVR